MSIFSRLFGRKNNLTVSSDIKKEDARSRNIAFVDTEVGLKDHKIHDIGALRYDGANFHQASQTALNKFLQEGTGRRRRSGGKGQGSGGRRLREGEECFGFRQGQHGDHLRAA